MSVKISNISFFSFSFKLDEEKSVIKKYGLDRGLQEKFCWMGEDLLFNRGVDP